MADALIPRKPAAPPAFWEASPMPLDDEARRTLTIASRAVANATRIDEAKDQRDKAMALQLYAKQACNFEMEQQCREIRVRAERRVGQLLRETERAKGVQGRLADPLSLPLSGCSKTERPEDRNENNGQTLEELGISRKQSSEWQKLATVPEEQFEEGLKDNMPTAGGIIHKYIPDPELQEFNARFSAEVAADNLADKHASDLLLYLGVLDGSGLFGEDASRIMDTMTPKMKKQARELVPRAIAWLERIEL